MLETVLHDIDPTRMLSGLMLRWAMFMEWRKLIAKQSWKRRWLASTSE